MIKRIRHKGLKAFFEKGHTQGIHPDWLPRIQRILTLLDAASEPASMFVPGFDLHSLKQM